MRPPVPTTKNLTLELTKHAKRTPDGLAIIAPRNNLTFSDLDSLVWKSAQYLYANGARAGDVLGLCFNSELNHVLAILGAIRLGATPMSVSVDLSEYQKNDLFTSSQTRKIVTDGDLALRALPVLRSFSVATLTAQVLSEYQHLLCADPDASVQYIVGSGTTGKAKLIPVQTRHQRARSTCEIQLYDFTGTDRVFCFPSLNFGISKSWLFNSILAGAAFVINCGSRQETIDLVARNTVSIASGTVFHAEKIILPDAARGLHYLKDLKALILGSSVITNDLRRRVIENVTKNLFVEYGTNEIWYGTQATPEDLLTTPETVGRVAPEMELEIVDSADHVVPADTIGHIRVQGAQMIDGYLNDDAATAQSFRDGWFYPGDFGKFTADGQLIYMGRSDDMMIFNGINIYSVEIEQTLAAHPAVADVAVMPICHRIHGDIPIAGVCLLDDADVQVEQLLHYVRERLGVRAPKWMFLTPEIPRNEQGKLIRAALSETLKASLRSNPDQPPTAQHLSTEN